MCILIVQVSVREEKMIAKDTDRENKTKTKKVNLRVPCVVDVEKNGDIFIRVVFRDTVCA